MAVGVALIGSLAFIAWAVLRVRDESQIPMLTSGFLVLGIALVVVALGCLRGIWRAATDARSGRAMVLAIVGGLAGLAAIGSFAASLVLGLLWRG